MKTALIVIVVMIAIAAPVHAAVPNAANSTVAPWDAYGRAFVCPGMTGADAITITVLDAAGLPCPGVPVAISFAACVGLCIDTPSGLTGMTNAAGVVVLDPAIGGCDLNCPVVVFSAGVVLRTYTGVTSADWDGTQGDGIVGPLDLQFFTSTLPPNPYNGCADYDGDGTISALDFATNVLCITSSNNILCPANMCLLNCPQLDGGPTGGGSGNRSPDLNGDANINLQDLAAFALCYPPNGFSQCCDYNCDGVISLPDLAQFAIHYGHAGNVAGICPY